MIRIGISRQKPSELRDWGKIPVGMAGMPYSDPNKCGTSGRKSILQVESCSYCSQGPMRFLCFFSAMEQKGSNNSLWTSPLRFGIKNKVKYGSPLRHMENQAQEHKHVSLISSFFVCLRAGLKAYSSCSPWYKRRKKKSFFFQFTVLLFTAGHRRYSVERHPSPANVLSPF